MTDGKLLIFHPTSVVGQKLASGLKGIGYDIAIATEYKGLIELAEEHKPHVIIWGAKLDDATKKIIGQIKENDENDVSIIAISEDPNLKLNDRIEAFNSGVNDFISLKENLVELKSKILFQKGAITQRTKEFRERKRLDILVGTNYNMILSQGLENLFEVAIDYLETGYPDCFQVFTIFNSTNTGFDFFRVVNSSSSPKLKTDQIRKNAIWRDYLLAASNQKGGEIKKPEMIEFLVQQGFNCSKMYHFPMTYKGNILGRLLVGCSKESLLDENEEHSLIAFTQILAHRVREVQKFYGLDKQSPRNIPAAQSYFERPSEDELIQSLCRELNKAIQADLCLYLNYNEGFRFLSPKYLYKAEDTENSFDSDKPPVLMLIDYPVIEQMVEDKKYQIIDLSKNGEGGQYKKLPGIGDTHVSNLVIFQLLVGEKIRGFLLLGRESIVKKYTRSELLLSEKLILSASKALEESEILKQAKLTVKQLNRIFELGTELTLDSSIDTILIKICTAIRRTLGWNVVILDKKNDFDENFYSVSVLGMRESDYKAMLGENDVPPFKSRMNFSQPISKSYFYDHHHESGQSNGQIIGEWNDNDWVYIPISSRGKLLGMISLNDPVERRKPTVERIKSVEYFANQAAVVIENTELFERLKSSELRYRLLAETMTMGLVTCNTTGKIQYVNSSLIKILGFEAIEDLLDKSFYDLCTDTSRHKLEKEVQRTMENSDIGHDSEDIVGMEIEILGENKETIPFMIYTSPFYQNKMRTGFFAVLSDLRNQKKIERMRADFNSMIVHDLRSPLNIIQGYVDIVRTGVVGEINEEQIELLTIAKDNVFKLLKLIDSFLTASKLEAGHLTIEPEINSLNSLIETLYEEYQVLVNEKKIFLKKDLDVNIPLLSFDKFRMEQVLRNYLSNAIKFTPPEGTITITSNLKKQKTKGDEFSLSVQAAVHDTGVGISQEEIGKVFNKYQQTEAGKDASLKGTGLGLAICREIIELHQGEVWVESKLHDGSIFGFTLPIQNINV